MTIEPQPTLFSRANRRLLKLAGWTVELRPPPSKKVVVIIYPHTSNWDFLVGLLAKWALQLPAAFIGKDSLFKGPLGPVMRSLGGIPVNRRESTGFVDQLVAEFARRDALMLAIAPEGTRSKTDHLKSGFYHVALAAKVPVGLGALDWKHKRVELTEWITLTGDRDADLARIRAYYAGKGGKFPEKASDLRWRE